MRDIIIHWALFIFCALSICLDFDQSPTTGIAQLLTALK